MADDVRKANFEFASGMVTTGFELLAMAVIFGGSAFFLQWGIWFIVVGAIVYSCVSRGMDAFDWVKGKALDITGQRND